MSHPQVTAFVPKTPPLKGENLSIGILVSNPTSIELVDQVCALTLEGHETEKHLGTILAKGEKTTSFNLDLERAGTWNLEFLIGARSAGSVGYKARLTIRINRDQAGSGSITIIGNQYTGDHMSRPGFGSETTINASGISDMLGLQGQASDSDLVSVPLHLEPLNARDWAISLDTTNKSLSDKKNTDSNMNNTNENESSNNSNNTNTFNPTITINHGEPEEKKGSLLKNITLISFVGAIVFGVAELTCSHFFQTRLYKTLFGVIKPDIPISDLKMVQIKVEDNEVVVTPLVHNHAKVYELGFGKYYTSEVKLEKAGFLRVFTQRDDGSDVQVYPGRGDQSNFFAPGTYRLPGTSPDHKGEINVIHTKNITSAPYNETLKVEWSKEQFSHKSGKEVITTTTSYIVK